MRKHKNYILACMAYYSSPKTDRFSFSSNEVPAKSSNAFSVTLNNMVLNKRRTFAGAIFRIF